jgi:hypothetical protein
MPGITRSRIAPITASLPVEVCQRGDGPLAAVGSKWDSGQMPRARRVLNNSMAMGYVASAATASVRSHPYRSRVLPAGG